MYRSAKSESFSGKLEVRFLFFGKHTANRFPDHSAKWPETLCGNSPPAHKSSATLCWQNIFVSQEFSFLKFEFLEKQLEIAKGAFLVDSLLDNLYKRVSTNLVVPKPFGSKNNSQNYP